jgi:threonine synthase
MLNTNFPAAPNAPDRSFAFTRQAAMSHMSCPRCNARYRVNDYPLGCPACVRDGFPANLQIEYFAQSAQTVAEELPYVNAISLGEGNTPLRLSSSTSGLYFKLESENPTGSHKDRMAAMGITRAVEKGAKLVVAASSGNAGVSIATYAGHAGIACDIAITKDCSDHFRQRIAATGARLIECPDSLSRWQYLKDAVRDPHVYALTNYALPAVGSPAIAIEGYKAVAWEIFQQLGECAPNFVFVPVARGDLLVGIARGFQSLLARGHITALPRLVAVEPFARLVNVMAGHDYRDTFDGNTQQFSTAGSTVTFQTVNALKLTNGSASVIDDVTAIRAQEKLRAAGINTELCAAATLAAYDQFCAAGTIASHDTAVLVITGRDEA